MIDLIERTVNSTSVAVIDMNGRYTYQQLHETSSRLARAICAKYDLAKDDRIAFMIPPSFAYVALQWAIWKAGCVVVPMCITYPAPSLQYVIEDTETSLIIYDKDFHETIDQLVQLTPGKYALIDDLMDENIPYDLPSVSTDDPAMILYTSGTTSKPKGVLTTHGNIQSQVCTLVDAWQWHSDDHIISFLPLHHVHGIINVVSCALCSGATVTFVHPFSPEQVFTAIREQPISVLMAVPTIYHKLIAYFRSCSEKEQSNISARLNQFRLMVSGSAALPVSVMAEWQSISGHVLLERYGMTEIGMAISNPYAGERKAGYIGQPLPGVSVRLMDEKGEVESDGTPGEIQIKGANVFYSYWNKLEATSDAFTADGWFCTGDIAVVENGYYRILGRNSVDIIKSGGYKISALEIEEVIRQYHPIKDCSVVGLPDEEWGEIVAAALVVEHSIATDTLNEWLRNQMPAYKVPRKYIVVDELPRNAMGKVTKQEVKQLFS